MARAGRGILFRRREKFYRGLIERLAFFGFEEGRNLFIAHYDWRAPVADLYPLYLVPVINEAKEKTGADKVHLVAHSLGGLVARSYVQSVLYGARNDVGKLIMLGTPNRGAADAYAAWDQAALVNAARVPEVYACLTRYWNAQRLASRWTANEHRVMATREIRNWLRSNSRSEFTRLKRDYVVLPAAQPVSSSRSAAPQRSQVSGPARSRTSCM